MTWIVHIHDGAARQLNAIPPDRRQRIMDDIKGATRQPPTPHGCSRFIRRLSVDFLPGRYRQRGRPNLPNNVDGREPRAPRALHRAPALLKRGIAQIQQYSRHTASPQRHCRLIGLLGWMLLSPRDRPAESVAYLGGVQPHFVLRDDLISHTPASISSTVTGRPAFFLPSEIWPLDPIVFTWTAMIVPSNRTIA
jgi:hypothetical protein